MSATLHERREILREAIASGTLKVAFGDREVIYQRTTDLLAALRELDAQIASAAGQPAVRFHYPRKTRGW